VGRNLPKEQHRALDDTFLKFCMVLRQAMGSQKQAAASWHISLVTCTCKSNMAAYVGLHEMKHISAASPMCVYVCLLRC